MEKKMSREDAWELLNEYTKTPALLKHALAVEAVMAHFARLDGEEEEIWGVAGLLHDLDYEKFPEEHCRKSEEIMREHNVDGNRSQSYACNLKLYNLGLKQEIENKLYDLMDTQEFFYARNELLDEFGQRHQYQWQAAMNGRSGGYLVLYQGELKPSGYKSYCIHCGQKNYSSVKETGNICGVCQNPSRVDYSNPHMLVNTFPGRGHRLCR